MSLLTLLYITSFYLLFFNVNFTHGTFSSREQRIIGGEDAYASQYPFAAAIHVQTATSRFFCGGALLHSEWVLTAGTCVYNATLLTIQLGSNELTAEDPNRVTLATSEYVVHPEFNPITLQNDLGLIRLRLPVTFTYYIKPVSFPVAELLNYTNTIRIMGWGQTSDFDAELSENLKYASVIVMSNEECKFIYGDQITENMACAAGMYNQGTCTGDNGGPLVEHLGPNVWLVGVSSFISANGCESTDPSGFTRTWPYLDWINSTIYG